MKEQRFADIGMPFRLFEAPVGYASCDPAGLCAVCSVQAPLRFSGACYSCFRAGKVENTIDTVYGMVRNEDAELGLTHGCPQLPADVPVGAIVKGDTEEDWNRVRVERAELIELVRTPSYHTWQGEQWQFCCMVPCIHVGPLNLEDLRRAADEDKEPLTSHLGRLLQVDDDQAAELLLAIENDAIGTYAFRCQRCSKLHAHWDMD